MKNVKKILRRTQVSLLAVAGVMSGGAIAQSETFKLEEATIASAEKALAQGGISSVELTVLYLNRVFAYDKNGILLNAIPVLNPAVLAEAAAADKERAAGGSRPLLGIPFTVKDSYKAKGMTVAAGSPAFAKMVANEDAFAVAQLRGAGGVLVGRTNMPPLAEGGMQRGVYGRAESPYNGDYLTAAYASGSSNGSGTATGANMAMFGMGEETVSSGRSPSSNNALVAYTPSRGLISIRGNWPLYPSRDVVVPMTRTMSDMFAVLNLLVVTDPVTRGDFWRDQKAVKLPTPESVRPAKFETLAKTGVLKGKRVAVPTMYIGKDPTLGRPIVVRPSIMALWEKAADDLRRLGAEVVEVDFKLMHNFEEDRANYESIVDRGLFPFEWWGLKDGKRVAPPVEFNKLNAYSYEGFIKDNADPNFPSWLSVDHAQIFPFPKNSVDFKRRGPHRDYSYAVEAIKAGVTPMSDVPKFAEAMQGLEKVRQVDLEQWMKDNKYDFVVFPANADVGRSNADVDEKEYDLAQRNGTYFSNMNGAMRHLGIPSISVPMGIMADIGMPINLTFIGPAYSDSTLLSAAYDYEQATKNRRPPTRTPALADETLSYDTTRVTPPAKRSDKTPPVITATISGAQGGVWVLSGSTSDQGGTANVRVFVNGHKVFDGAGKDWKADVRVIDLKTWSAAGSTTAAVIVLAKDQAGNAAATLEYLPLPNL